MSVDVARANIERYGQFPLAGTFSNNDSVNDDLGDDSQPSYSAAFDADDSIKRHAACDECRKRKLKCSGEPTGCARCVKQSLICHYSEQKQMGRPRKRQKTDDSPPVPNPAAGSPRPIQPAVSKPSPEQSFGQQWDDTGYIDPSLATVQQERSQFENICNGPMARTIQGQRQTSRQQPQDPGLQSINSDSSHSQAGIPTPDQSEAFGPTYPTDVAQWPDFSTMDALPLPLEDKFSGLDASEMPSFDPDANPDTLSNLPPIPGCPCLPNLYLTLSTLSTLSSFPFTWQTVSTVESGYKTAKDVIYCAVCPQKFDTGSSNLMLGTTLLNVLGDQWKRFKRLGVDDIRKSFGTTEQQRNVITIKEGQSWRTFQYEMIRAYVFGDHAIPTTPGATPIAGSEPTYPAMTLMGLCEALERRQKQWHSLLPADDEFPDRVTPELQQGHIVGESHDQPGRHLCIEIVGHAKCTISCLDGPIKH